MFCLYAEDAGIFGSKSMFHDYLRDIPASGIRKALVELFRILDQKPEQRDKYLADDNPALAAFPYVNGGLFSDENIEIPPFTEELKNLLLEKASGDFDWSVISPTIFGAVFESTLNPETRHSGGMHYTPVSRTSTRSLTRCSWTACARSWRRSKRLPWTRPARPDWTRSKASWRG